LIEICELFWEIDDEFGFVYRVSDIAAQFGLRNRDISKIVGTYCQAHSPGEMCIQCGQPAFYTSRSDFQQKTRWRGGAKQWICAGCERSVREERAREYERQQLEELEKKRTILRDAFDLEYTITLDPKVLSLEDAIYLISFVRLGASEDFEVVEPILTLPGILAPTPKLTYEILKRLIALRIIIPHPASVPDAFNFEDDRIKSYHLDRVKWGLVFGADLDQKKKTIQAVETILKSSEWPDEWQNQRQTLWKKVALEECLAYLNVCMTEHKFSFNPGDKTYLVLDSALEDFSIAQVYNLVWAATRDAAAYQVREGVSRNHAANMVIGSIQRKAERALAEGWQVKAYRRDFRCPQSAVTSVLFNLVLQIGEAAFGVPPRTRDS